MEERPVRSKHMKNANIFVDVDLTLVDASGKLLDGAREALLALKKAGCHLFLWSSVGADYCRKSPSPITSPIYLRVSPPSPTSWWMTCRPPASLLLYTMCNKRSRGQRWPGASLRSILISENPLR